MKLIFSMCIICVVNFCLAEDDSMPEDRLRKSLMDKYNKDAIPPHNDTSPIVVGVGFNLVSIRDIDEKLKKIKVSGLLKLSWKDSRLSWDPEKHNGIDWLAMGVKYLWMPDVTLYNRADVPIDSPTDHALLYPTGTIVWVPWSHLTALCELNSTYYPYDTHNCTLKFGSWTYDAFHLDLELYDNKSKVDVSEMWENNEWNVVSTSARKNVAKYECCQELYPDITFYFILQRHSSVSQAAIQFPIVSGIILAFTAFIISPFNKQRLFINAIDVIILLLTLLYLQQLLPIFTLNSPTIVLICESMILLVSLAIAWNIGLLSINRRCCKSRPPKLVQWLTNSWMITVLLIPKKENIHEFCNEQVDVDQSHDDLTVVDIGTEVKNVVMNVWMTFFFLLDRLFFMAFIAVFVSLLSMFTG